MVKRERERERECSTISNCTFFVYQRKAIPTGMIAGASAQFLASPTDLVKIILQAEGKKLLEGKPIK